MIQYWFLQFLVIQWSIWRRSCYCTSFEAVEVGTWIFIERVMDLILRIMNSKVILVIVWKDIMRWKMWKWSFWWIESMSMVRMSNQLTIIFESRERLLKILKMLVIQESWYYEYMKTFLLKYDWITKDSSYMSIKEIKDAVGKILLWKSILLIEYYGELWMESEYIDWWSKMWW